ncbi:MAG TPA: hypothetical protein VF269_09665 [Rhodanobacteraceae bacterium]
MFEALVVVAVLIGAWFALACVGLVFKLLFGVIGGFFSVIGTLVFLCVGGAVALAVLPVVVFALLPVWLPLLALGVVVWLLVRGPRRPVPAHASRYMR